MEFYSLNGAIAKADELHKEKDKEYIVYTNDMIKYIVVANDDISHKHVVYKTE